ncbi:MAG: PilN domain-containing protein [Coriobacteriia bacterium]|nr:PilN domain-containing protein [Coriobacteriia bacterium]
MMRINLLPPEILERRKAERRFGWIIVAAVLVAVVLAGTWAFAHFRLQARQDELAEVQQQVQSTNAQAAHLAVFEERAATLETRRSTAALALDGRRNWGRLFSELSLVMPSDIWLNALTAEESAVTFAGWAVDSPTDSPDVGHKSMAKLLVRLADLEQLSNVWLTSSEKGQFEEQPAIQFTVTADVSEPTAGSDTP